MADNGIYSDGFQDGRGDLLNDLAEMFDAAETPEELYEDIKSILQLEGAL